MKRNDEKKGEDKRQVRREQRDTATDMDTEIEIYV